MVKPTEALAVAAQHHREGNLALAEQLYRQALHLQPDSLDALNSLGIVLAQQGRSAEAETLFREALRLAPGLFPVRSNLGNLLKRTGRLAETEACYREGLRWRPTDPNLLNDLGTVLATQGQFAEATACYREALRSRPHYPEAYYNLGGALAAQGKHAEALASYELALRLKPDYAEAHHNRGNVLEQIGQLAAAEASYQQALRLRPDSAYVLNSLGLILDKQGRVSEAEDHFRAALRQRPDFPEALCNLAIALARQNQHDQALACAERAVRIKPDSVPALNNLGTLLAHMGRLREAEAAYRRALLVRPNHPEMLYNLGVALAQQGRIDEALAAYEQAVSLKPDYADGLNNLAKAYADQGCLDEALGCYRRAMAARPNDPAIVSNFLMVSHYHPAGNAEALFAEHLRWAARFGTPPACPLPARDRNSPRRLRLGYVSPDFWNHVQGYYSEAVIGAHDRSQFEVFCYANVSRPDERTQRIKGLADHWRSILGLSDTEAADLILQDEIDLLIDLAGHTAGNRLGVFARKPAPVQVTHFGYCDTTGLVAMDYRLTDACCDPPGQTERFHTEHLIRLPHVQWCYAPPPTPEVGPLPAHSAGHVTFGCFNNLCKVTEQMIGLWAKLLEKVPGSRFHLLTGAGTAGDDRVRRLFHAQGVGPERLTLLGKRPRDTYFQLYHDVDLCLDTYPYNGCNTTADALWMGVPWITLAGDNWISRQGAAVLLQAGLDELVTSTPAAYVAAATVLAHDLPRLHELRAHLRERLRRSPLMDVPAFTRNLESAYRQMWETFCRAS